MARIARVVAPGVPHHVTQRGNRRQQTFFSDDDHELYRELMAVWCERHGVAIWAYCLMPNHVHLIATPASAEGLRRGIGEAHRRYARHVNFREGWRGYLWQGRFASFPLGGAHLLAAVRYVELNPVRAGLVAEAEDWPWSSARAHLAGGEDRLARAAAELAAIGDWRASLRSRPRKRSLPRSAAISGPGARSATTDSSRTSNGASGACSSPASRSRSPAPPSVPPSPTHRLEISHVSPELGNDNPALRRRNPEHIGIRYARRFFGDVTHIQPEIA